MDEISRMEKILRGDPIDPITRLEIFCAMAAGTWSGDPLTPVSRLEYFLSQISGGGGGGETKSTFIRSIPNLPSEYHYTTTAASYAQQTDAPEGVVYDKVWIPDEYISQMANDQVRIEHFFLNYSPGPANYFTSRTSMKSYVTNSGTTTGFNNLYFMNNSNLKDVVIHYAGVFKLNNINAFQGTPFASGGSGGTLWVPENQISAYQSATNWSTILGYANNQIKKIEGSVWE